MPSGLQDRVVSSSHLKPSGATRAKRGVDPICICVPPAASKVRIWLTLGEVQAVLTDPGPCRPRSKPCARCCTLALGILQAELLMSAGKL